MKLYTLRRCGLFLLALALVPALPAVAAVHFSETIPLSEGTGFAFAFGSAEKGLFSGNRNSTVPDKAVSKLETGLETPKEVSGLAEEVPLPEEGKEEEHSAPSEAPPEPETSLRLPGLYRVLDAGSGQVLELSPFDYICGVTAAEIPIGFQEEAIKAQAVAAHSYALRQMGIQLKKPDPALEGAFLSTDPAHFQAYLSREERQALWGEEFAEKEARLEAAVAGVINQILVYEEEPIAAAFHSISSGRTESARDIWGQDLPYLIQTDSPEDAENPRGTEIVRLSTQEVSAILGAHVENPKLGEDPSAWIQVKSRTESGTVLTALAGGVEVTGENLRQWMGLASANFTIAAEGDGLVFTAKGRGHGVGMSQYGADAMAAAGKSWREILARYYPGTEVVKVMDN